MLTTPAEFARGALEAAPDAMIIIDSSGIVCYANRQVSSLFGYAHDEIIGQNVEKSANERRGVEVTVLLDSGKYIAVVQEADDAFRPGDRVRVLTGRGGSTRVTH